MVNHYQGKRPQARVQWPRYVRLVNSAYPPIDLFEDIADPEDWALLAAAEARTNPRIAETIGNLDLVPVDRRVNGPGASYLMAPFTHASPERAGRFHDGHFGAFYAGDSFEVALAETIHHQANFYRSTNEASGWVTDMRELTGKVDAVLTEITADDEQLLHPSDYSASQAFATMEKQAGADGIVYPSVRQRGGQCIATFYPDVVEPPVQGRHLSYHWDGEKIDMIKDYAQSSIYKVIPD